MKYFVKKIQGNATKKQQNATKKQLKYSFWNGRGIKVTSVSVSNQRMQNDNILVNVR